MTDVQRGDRYEWHGIHVCVTRVSADPYRPWADLRCWGSDCVMWSKRMPLPLPKEFQRVTHDD